MAATELTKSTTRRFIAALVGLVLLIAVGTLSNNVAHEIRLLGSASSDNLQWSLAQTEVELLELQNRIKSDPVDLRQLRRRFDVFYSRFATVTSASVFTELRANEESREFLIRISDYIADAVLIVDQNDAALLRDLPELLRMTEEVRPIVRAFATSGLRLYAQKADDQREAVARTLIYLAEALALLIGLLALMIVYLYRLNRMTAAREREKNQSVKRMNTVINTSLDGVIVSDVKGNIIEFSPAAEDIFGHNFEDVVGRGIGEIIVPDHMRDAHDAGMERMQRGGERRVVGKGRVQLDAKRSNGQIFPIEMAIQSATTDQGQIFIAFLRDISLRVAADAELVAARDKALASEKMKTDFLATMSHEIRTPLNGLLGNLSLLKDTQLDGLQARYVGYMESSGRLLMSHISDVLDITRYDAGKLTALVEPMNISALLQDIIDNQSSTASRNETALDWGWDGPATHWINSDHDRLQHVMMNLIGNAVKFTKRGKVSVTVRKVAQADNDQLQIEITDTGPGISDELAGRIFDDFVTGNTAYDREVGGTGLGLSIAKRFVTALGGTIGVQSEVGKGSTFWVKIPVVASQEPDAANVQAEDAPVTRSLKILLVEDNEINRIVAREMLESEGHSVTLARDGREGVEKATGDKFDLIFMDISMPVMDGRAATREIRKGQGASANAPIIAFTANAMAGEQENFKADGMTGVLTKPLSRSALRNALTAHQPQNRTRIAASVSHDHYAETREALGEEAFVKLRTRFINEVEDHIAWLQSDETLDYLEISGRSHKVAGSAAVFGAVQLRETLRAIETAANAGDNAMIERLVFGISCVWRDTKTALLASPVVI